MKIKPFFLTLLASAFMASPLLALHPIPDDAKVGGFAIGPQAYSFRLFSATEAIEKAAQAGAKVIELYPGQKLSPEKADKKLHHTMGDEDFQLIQEQLKKHNIRPVNYGVVGGKDEAEWRSIFQFADKLKVWAITTEDVKNIDIIEKLAKEFDINVAYHEHPKKENDPSYQLWNPEYVLSLVKDRDARIGVSADTGHWASSNVDPLNAIKLLKGRILSLHLKDRPEIGKRSTDQVFGTGVLKIGDILAELKAQDFKGNISIEFEANWENNVPDIKGCIDFVRAWGEKNAK